MVQILNTSSRPRSVGAQTILIFGSVLPVYFLFVNVALAQNNSAPSSGRKTPSESAPSMVDEADTDEVLSRLMQYEQRILKFEKKEAPSPFVPEGDAISRDRGGEGTGEIFHDKADKATATASLKDLSRENGELEQRIAVLESALKNSEELVRELKKVRPSASELGVLETQVKDRDREITRLKDNVAELERASKQPRLREEEAVASVAQITDANRVLKIENSKLLDQLAKFKQQIIDLTERVDTAGVREEQLKKQIALAKEDSAQAEEGMKKVQRSVEVAKALEQEKVKLQSTVVELKTELDSAKKDLEKRKISEATLSALKKESDDAKVKITELEEQAKGKASIQAKLDKAGLETQELTKQRELLVKERDDLLGGTNQLRQELAKLRDEHAVAQTKFDGFQSELKSKDEEVAEANRQLSKAIQESKECTIELAKAQDKATRITEVENALIKAKNDLLLKETEIRMLSGGNSRASGGTLDSPSILPEPSAANSAISSKPSMRDLAARITPIDKVAGPDTSGADVLVVEVIAKKVNLRSGPGNEHAPLMQVQAGTQLTVESKEGDWYRVLTPTGSRAYIRTDVVRQPGSAPVKPVARKLVEEDESADLEPFKLNDSKPKTRDEDEETQAFESLKAAIKKGSQP